jgi:hypothetical protein
VDWLDWIRLPREERIQRFALYQIENMNPKKRTEMQQKLLTAALMDRVRNG